MPKRKPARRPPAARARGPKVPAIVRRAAPRQRAVTKPEPVGLSLRAFARRQGVNLWAVQKSIASGRLSKSLLRSPGGRVAIGDIALAEREWTENASQQPGAPTNGDGGFGSLSEAQRRVALERERKLKLDNLQREGRLIDRARAEREAFEIARTVRDAILGVPDRVSAELAAETDQARVHRRLEEELRTALGALADVLAGEGAHADARAVGDGDGGDADAAR